MMIVMVVVIMRKVELKRNR